MKPYVTHGIGVTVVGALLTFALYFLGAHNDVEKMQATSSVAGFVAGFVVPAVAIFLTLRATRAAAPDGGLTYGQGVLNSLLLGVVAGVLGAIFNYVYGTIINPGMFDTIHEMQIAQLEAQGKMSAEQIDQAAAMMKKFTTPLVTSAFALFGSILSYTVYGLIVSIFVRRAPAPVPPAPPPAEAMS